MSRSNKNSSEALEALRSENRKLESEIKKLERKIEASEKPKKVKLHTIAPSEPVIEPTNLCAKCKSKDLVEIELGPKKYKICNECKARKLIPNA